jgi:hypothetical protein
MGVVVSKKAAIIPTGFLWLVREYKQQHIASGLSRAAV